MALFPSRDWLAQYIELVNASDDFAEAARTFRADLSYVFEAEPECGHPCDVWATAGVVDGHVTWWSYDNEEDGARAQFVLRGPYSLWRDIIVGDLDPMEAMLDGDLAVTGHLPTLLRYVRAADELVRLATKVPTQFRTGPSRAS